MKRLGSILKSLFWVVTALALILTVTMATFAWFTSNRVVDTDSVSGRSGSDNVELQLSSRGGDSFSGSQEAQILQVNQTSSSYLLPVSTADLTTFLYSPATVEDQASNFQVVENEEYYYHGRIYIKAVGDNQEENAKMALYLDQQSDSGGVLAQADSGDLLKASRLGLTFDDENPVIFYLSEDSGEEQVRNTVLGGATLEDGQVLEYSQGSVRGRDDPSVPLSAYTVTFQDDSATLPEEPLCYLELNKIYKVDIYFYLEGCDPDCSDGISYDAGNIHLAFYGILD